MDSDQQTVDLSDVSFPSSVEYTLKHELGRGGMGIVFLAERNACGVVDEVVLKTVISISEDYIERLKKEANIATALRHENIVKSYGMESVPVDVLPNSFRDQIDGLEHEVGKTMRSARRRQLNKFLKKYNEEQLPEEEPDVSDSDEEIFLICMDYVEGMDLEDLYYAHMDRGLLIPVPLIGFIVSRICRALGYAHERIIHRDVSPGNILINRHGVCKLTDFGVAVETDEPVNLIVGKAEYMSPEQLQKEPVDERSDLFSLGVVAYELLTGIRLFDVPNNLDAPEKVEYVKQLHTQSFPPPHEIRPDIPEVFSDVVHKMIQSDPDDRPEDAMKAGDTLEQEYLYAEGFGPTNNSLASYIDIFESKFEKCSAHQLSQLKFLETYEESSLQRKFNKSSYTEKGVELLNSSGFDLSDTK